ncbi:Protein SIEVE ELEMENT OCCLUSION B [Linum perenne]
MSCKCSGGGDAHSTTMAVLDPLKSYAWDAKVVISLAAFAVNYGEFHLVMQLLSVNPLAKSVAVLKQLPDIIEQANSLKPQFDALNKLITAVVDVTKCMVELKELPSHYIGADTPAMSLALAHIPMAVYWAIRSIVVSATLIARNERCFFRYIDSTSQAWELSSLAHKVENIHDLLKQQLVICYQHIDEKRHEESYQLLVRLFDTHQLDNMKILKALIYPNDDQQPLFHGATKTKVHVEVLKRKHVLLLISDLRISNEEVMMLAHMYTEAQGSSEFQYEVVWLPVVDRLGANNSGWQEADERKFMELQSVMPWYSIIHPSLMQPAAVRYVKEAWHFAKRTILVPLDPAGRVMSTNAFHMLWIWGNLAFPFTMEREESLWRSEDWSLQLLVDRIDMNIMQWATQGKLICLYGGEDIEWIRKFSAATKEAASAYGTALEMVYVGKNNIHKERMTKINAAITSEGISHCWADPSSVWLFWTRLESMFYSKIQRGRTMEEDRVLQEVMTLLSFDGGDGGWAVICSGEAEMARAKGELALASMEDYEKWANVATEIGFVPAVRNYLQGLHTPLHCNRLILPGMEGGVPDTVVCAECGRAMEKFFMYRCCVD